MSTRVNGKIRSQVTELAVGDEDGKFVIRGYANRPIVNRYVEKIDHPTAFQELMPRFLSNPIMLWSHSPHAPIGLWTKVEPRGEGLYVEGEISAKTDVAEEARGLIRSGIVKALSIGFREIDGGMESDGVWHVRKLDLYEISVVAIPADFEALFDFDDSADDDDRAFRSLSLLPGDPIGGIADAARGEMSRGYLTGLRALAKGGASPEVREAFTYLARRYSIDTGERPPSFEETLSEIQAEPPPIAKAAGEPDPEPTAGAVLDKVIALNSTIDGLSERMANLERELEARVSDLTTALTGIVEIETTRAQQGRSIGSQLTQ